MSLKVSSRFILVIGDDGILLVPDNVRDLGHSLFVGDHDAEAAEEMIELLEEHEDVPVTILADIMQQDIRHELMPKLGLLDRKKLLERRLEAAFLGARFTGSGLYDAKTNNFVLASIGRGGPVAEWLDRLDKLSNPCEAIALLPLESAEMINRLSVSDKEWHLFLSWQRTGGLRQIVTHRGRMLFTRLTPAPAHDGEAEIASAVSRDIAASMGYLKRYGLQSESQLHVTIVMGPDDLKQLEGMRLSASSTKFMTPNELALFMKLPFVPEADETYADLVHAVYFMGKKRPALELKDQTEKVATGTPASPWIVKLASFMAFALFLLCGWQVFGLWMNMQTLKTVSVQKLQTEGQLAIKRNEAGILDPVAPELSSPLPLLTALSLSLPDPLRATNFSWDMGQTGEFRTRVTFPDASPDIRKTLKDTWTVEGRQFTADGFESLPFVLTIGKAP